MAIWKHSTFVKFFKKDPLKAFQYRKDCLGIEIPEEYLEKINPEVEINEVLENINTDKDWEPEVLETLEVATDTEGIEEVVSEETQPIEFTREELIEKLKSANIFVPPKIKDDTLLKKCIENNLI